MGWYLWVMLAYLLVLAGFNFYRSRQVKSQDDFMVAGRKLSLTVMVFTLVCTWIGSGTFIAGAEYAAQGGLELPVAARRGVGWASRSSTSSPRKIRTFGQYTVGDILEVRYGKFARLFGAIALIIAFTTIVSYQFRAGGYILNVVTEGAISVEVGQTIAAAFVILFTALGGMVAVAHTDLPNGIIILLGLLRGAALRGAVRRWVGRSRCRVADAALRRLLRRLRTVPGAQGGGYFLVDAAAAAWACSPCTRSSTPPARPQEAKRAVAIWIVGTIVVETLVVAIAIYGAAAHWADIKAFEIGGRVKVQVASGELQVGAAEEYALRLAAQEAAAGNVKPDQVASLEGQLSTAFAGAASIEAVAGARVGIDPAAIVLQCAEDITSRGGIGLVVGLLLLGAACAVVISTGMNYLLSPTTNIMRDVYQRFLNPEAPQARMVALQKVFVVILGVCAFLMIFVPTVLHARISVLRYAFFAYTMYGVAITPALLAALTWRRATRAGGLASIVSGAVMAIVFELVIPNAFPAVMLGGDPWGIPSIYPAALVSIGALVVVSLLTPKPTAAELEPLFGTKVPAA